MSFSVAEFVRKFSPHHLFEEFTNINDVWKDAITKRCMECNMIPHIQYHEPDGCFIFHSLCDMTNNLIYKKGCSDIFAVRSSKQIEKQIETSICNRLHDKGLWFRRQVRCAFGIVDVVTELCVIEVKANPDKQQWQKAIGQVLSYRACFEKSVAAICADIAAPRWVASTCDSVGILIFTDGSVDGFIETLRERV